SFLPPPFSALATRRTQAVDRGTVSAEGHRRKTLLADGADAFTCPFPALRRLHHEPTCCETAQCVEDITWAVLPSRDGLERHRAIGQPLVDDARRRIRARDRGPRLWHIRKNRIHLDAQLRLHLRLPAQWARCARPRDPAAPHGHIEASVVMAAPDISVCVDGLDREECVPGFWAGMVELDDLTHGSPSFARGSHRHASEATQTTAPNREGSPLHGSPASSPSGCAPQGRGAHSPTAKSPEAWGEGRGRAQVAPEMPRS